MNLERKRIRVFVCDDMPEIVKYFRMILEHEEDIEVVGTAFSAQEAYGLIIDLKPDVVLMDIQMETGEAGIELTEKLKEYDNKIKVIMITIHQKDDLIFKAYLAGAIDYIQKTASVTDIVNAIRNVHESTISLRPELAQTILGEFSRLKKQEASMLFMVNIISTLTNAELDVLMAFADGKKRTVVAKERFVELSTINKQITSILKKTGYKSIKSLVQSIEKNGIVENLRTLLKN